MLGPAAQVLGRTATRRGCEELREQLQAALCSVLESPADRPELRASCDRVIRACIQRLGDSGAGADGGGEGRAHLSSLLGLAVLACEGHRASSGPGGCRSAPLYLERLVFHLLRCSCARGLAPSCQPLCQQLLTGLSRSPQPEAGGVGRSAFALLWGAAPTLPPGPGLSLRLRALRLLALDPPSSTLLAQRFAQSCRLYLQGEGGEGAGLGGETLSLLRDLLKPPPLEEGLYHHQQQQLALCCQLALQAASSLSKTGFPAQARELLQGAGALLLLRGEGKRSPFPNALRLARLSPGLQAPSPSPGQALSRALATLRSAGGSPGPPGRRALAAGCRFLLSELRPLAERSGGRGGERAPSPGLGELLQLSAFLHLYLEQEVSSSPDAGTLKLCYQNLDLFTRAVYEFLMDPEEADSDGADQLLSPCKQIVEKMVEVEEGLVSHEQTDYIGATGLRLYNLAYGFYSRKLFGEAVQMAVMLQGDTHPPDLFSRSTLPPDRVLRFYKLLVQCYRKLGELEKAMEAVCMWLMALGDQRVGQETEPIALWACLKADAVNRGDEELQLRTLRDTLQPWGVRSPRLTQLLQEELRAYKGLQTDTSRERFNVICDLLQLCSPPGPETVTEPDTLHLRAVQLLELAQLLCYRDFTQHTECSAMDCVDEALAILGSLKETPENWEQLLDDRANAYLWRYVCDLESRIRESVERCRRLGSIPETGLEPEDGDPNDMDYEEKQQGALSVHDHIDFNLTAESKRCEPLDEALSLWKRLLHSGSPPTLRNPEQTAHALHLTAALYRLMDKPFQVIDSYGLLLRLLEPRGDKLPVANVLLQLGETLLSVHCLGPVQTCLDRVELLLNDVDSGKGGLLLAKTTCTLLRSHLLWATSRVPKGLVLLSEVLACPSLHKPSKVWYLLKAKLQQLVAAYLSLPPSALPPSQRRHLQQHGWMTPESALTDAHKMLCGIIMLLCPGMLPFGKSGSELNCPLNPGDNLSQKWQVLSDLLSCSGRMVSLLTALGSSQEAKMFCLETLRLTAKLHCVRPCVEFLVASAELEGLRGDLQARDLDLRLVQHLLEPSADFLPECRPRAGSRIHPRKAHAHGPPSSSSLPTPAAQEEGRGVSPPPAAALLRARPLSLLETVTSVPGGAASGSPPLGGPAPQPDPLPLLHPEGCPCPVCGDPSLTGSCLRWALLKARAGGAPSLETVRRRCRERAEAFSHSLLGLALQALGRPCPELLPSSPGLYSYLEARAYSQEARAYSQEARAYSQEARAYSQEARAWFSSKPAGPWQLEQARASLLLALVSQERGLSRLLPPAAPASSPPPPPPPPQSRRKAPRPTASSTTTSTGGRPRAPARSGPRTRLRKRFDDSDLEPEGEEEQGGAGRKGRGRRGTQARTRPRGEAEESKGEDRLETDDAADLDPVYRCLSEACSAIRHCPPSSLYPQLCQLLALCVPGGDAYTTAYLLTESVAVTARHQMMQSLHRKSQKLRKECSRDVTESLQGLSLSDNPETDPDWGSRARYLSELESLFDFSVTAPAHWPQDDVQLFKERLTQIPDDVTVCLLTLTSLNPRGDREELLQLTRLRKGRVPITVGIPARVSSVLSEFDSILAEQREISNETELKAWWDGRTSLDRRMRGLVESLETDVLGCWKGLLLSAPPDPRVDSEAAAVCGLLVGPRDSPSVDDELLKAMLGASSVLSDSDVQSLADRLCGAKGQKVLSRLQAAVHTLRCLPTDPPRTCSSQLVLILDKHLQRLPWESVPTLRAHRVSRLPSFQFLLAYAAASKLQLRSVLTEGLNPSSVYYVLNPQGNLPNTEKTFKDWFRRRPGWEGVVGRGPSEGKLKSVLCNRDLYLYAGHGAGVRFLEGQEVQKLNCRAASFLLGCSSAALSLRGDLEGVGILLKYMMAGCPLFLGNLWDVTDKDIDRYMDRLLRGWLEAGSRTSLLEYVAQARTAPKLKYLIGASPVVYGLSVSLQ